MKKGGSARWGRCTGTLATRPRIGKQCSMPASEWAVDEHGHRVEMCKRHADAARKRDAGRVHQFLKDS